MIEARRRNTLVNFSLLFFYLLLIIRNSWISDDAMITFRVVENFLAGYGLGFNPFVRVQVFTHPLWMLVISFFYFLQRLVIPSSPNGLFHLTIFLSLLLSFGAVFLIVTRVSVDGTLSRILTILILSLSFGFVDYSTSGLENPLTHFLIVLFAINYLKDRHNLFVLSLISSMVMLNRIDAFIMLLPALAYAWFSSKEYKLGFFQMLYGFAPIILWELFSLFYFGFPFPNTAYAKLNTGISSGLLFLQGMDYLLNSINWDPIILFSIGFAGVGLYLYRNTRLTFLYFGVLLYLGYVVKIGGDFMSGRFLTAPLLLSVVIISNHIKMKREILTAIGIVLLLGVFSVRSPLQSSNMVLYSADYPIGDNNGISDQRLYYFGNPQEGQFNSFVENGFRDTLLGSEFAGEKWYFSGLKKVILTGALGKPAYQRGPDFYFIDDFALSDPLLARLPVLNKYWQIGHFHRDLPEGYYQTLETNENKIVDPDLALYYSKLSILTTGRLRTWERMVEIWKFNTGQYDYLIEKYNSRISK
jgi:arabinofuranosyltransferase